MTQKKFLQFAGIAVAFVWVFCITFAVAYTMRNAPSRSLPVSKDTEISTGVVNFTTTPTTMPSTAPSTTAQTLPTLALPDVTPDISSSTSTAPSTQDTTVTTTKAHSSIPEDKNEIINAYINGVNSLKNTQNFSMKKNDTLNVTITDVQMTGGSALKGAVMDFANGIIAPPEPESYTFVEGKDAATGETPNSTIAPLNLPAQVNPDAVTDATAAKNADGGYTINLTLQPETQTMNAPAPNLSTMVEVIDVSGLLPSGATMNELNVNYAPSTIRADFDSRGRIVAMEHKLTSKGGGSGKMIINVSMTMEGTYTSNYIITYN